MKLTLNYFRANSPTKQIADLRWEGYLEAGKTTGNRDYYGSGNYYANAYQEGWDLRKKEIEESETRINEVIENMALK